MKIATAILILCCLNFFAFFISSTMIGGSSANGSIKDGRYFVSDHGKDTEVSEQVWNLSLWHSRSLFLTHPLAFALFLILGPKWDKRRKEKTQQVSPGNTLPRPPRT